MKQLINHKGGTKNKRTVEGNWRAIETVELAVQNVELQTDLRDAAFANNNAFRGKSKHKECGFVAIEKAHRDKWKESTFSTMHAMLLEAV